MERKLTKVVDGTEIIETGKMCSCGTDVANDLCSWECPDTCGVCRLDVCVQRSWQMLTGESPVVVKVGQPLSQ